jgi:hypothetical protein
LYHEPGTLAVSRPVFVVKLVRGVGPDGMKSSDMTFRRLSNAKLSEVKEAYWGETGRESHRSAGERYYDGKFGFFEDIVKRASCLSPIVVCRSVVLLKHGRSWGDRKLDYLPTRQN